jgi:hypothetical protein
MMVIPGYEGPTSFRSEFVELPSWVPYPHREMPSTAIKFKIWILVSKVYRANHLDPKNWGNGITRLLLLQETPLETVGNDRKLAFAGGPGQVSLHRCREIRFAPRISR